jgi:hypothetical protein
MGQGRVSSSLLSFSSTLLILVFIGVGFLVSDSDGDPPASDGLLRGNRGLAQKDTLRTPAGLQSIHDIPPCNRSRVIIRDSSSGTISDGNSNYTQDTTCEWLISGMCVFFIDALCFELCCMMRNCSRERWINRCEGLSLTRRFTSIVSFLFFYEF